MKNYSSVRFLTENAITLKNEYSKTLIKQIGVIEDKLTPSEIIQHFKNLPKKPNWTDFEKEFVVNGKMRAVPRNAYPTYLKWLHTGKIDGNKELADKFKAIDEIEIRHEEIFYSTGGTTIDEWRKTLLEKFKTIKAHELAKMMRSMIVIKRKISDSRVYLEKQKDKLIEKNKFVKSSEQIDKLEKLYRDALNYIEKSIFNNITEEDLSQGHCLDLKISDEEIIKLNDKIWKAYQKMLAR